MDFELPEICTERIIRRARKNHRCCECGELILAGLPYKRIAGKWNGEFSQYKFCMTCVDLVEWYLSEIDNYEYGYGFTTLYENIYESLTGNKREVLDECPHPDWVLKMCDGIEFADEI